jgi:hypothetical protein
MLSTYNFFILVVSLLVQHNLKYVISNAHCFGGIGCTMTEFSWDVKYAGLQIMASKVKSNFFISHYIYDFAFAQFQG